MNSWSIRRKRIILALAFVTALFFIGVPLFFLFYKVPTCFDGAMNGDEKGIDCGGSCQKLCTLESLPIITKGDARLIRMATSTYIAVAYLENPNAEAGVYRARYNIKIFDKENIVPIKKIEGSAFVPKGSRFAIYEGPFLVDQDVVPVRAILSWEEPLLWEKNISSKPPLELKSRSFLRTESSPRLEVVVGNSSLNSVSNIDMTSLVFDENGNIFAAAKTFIDRLDGSEETRAIFSWPRPLEGRPVEIEILMRAFPDRSFIR